MSTTSQDVTKLARKMFLLHQVFIFGGAPSLLYLLSLMTGLTAEQSAYINKLNMPVTIFSGLIIPYLVMKWAVRRALEAPSGLPEGTRLLRLLQIPSIISNTMLALTIPSTCVQPLLTIAMYGKSIWVLPWALITVSLHMMLLMILELLLFERLLFPLALEEYKRSPSNLPRGRGILWPRQAWLLPYAFAVFVLCTLATALTIVGRLGYDALALTVSQFKGGDLQLIVEQTMLTLLKNSATPMSLIGGYLLAVAAATAWGMARRQTQGAKGVQVALEGLAQGRPVLPEWVSTDEIGDLSAATARVFEQLRAFSLSLRDSAIALQRSAAQLGQSTSKQTEAISVQATAIQETQVTAEEFRQTSQVAAQTAGNIMSQAERAREISASGEAAIQEGLAGIEEVGAQVRQMATSIKSLDERARQIARITAIVKDLADQSNMLALNAAIEAVRSGESGQGFGVVAKEIRSLADQSIRATNNIRSILQDISSASATAAALSEKGTQRVEASLKQIRTFSQQVQQLTAITRDNGNSVRQISAAVTQQDAGIAQITQAVTELTRIMDQTMSQLRASEQALSVVREVADQVNGAVGQYGWSSVVQEEMQQRTTA
ncbi:methyl-accepting chemotaxis protein [Archangium lipolyticum]|uniref:methyl-accepting chemotaxis protein n=1 Tax=Archangium lipolyticum TaxID=2970465 RepID=UPI002149A7B5|nr:methyl-accepting chemotaxis protein [Archangium lipolyticum]